MDSVPDSMRPASRVADEPAHVVRLLHDDAGEFAHLLPLQVVGLVHHRRRGAPDGGQRRAQLVAHESEELRALALDLVERREVLQGDHHRARRVARGEDRRRVDQRPHAAPVRHG